MLQKNFQTKRLAAAALLMLALVVVAHALCLHFFPKPELDPPDLSDFWPMSVFRFRIPSWTQLVWGAGVGLAFLSTRRLLAKPGVSIVLLWVAGLVLVTATSLLHGAQFGLEVPTAGSGASGIEYWHDAVLIKSAGWFLRNFNELQPVLLEHARTHPPGAVLFYYVLHHSLRSFAAISVVVAGLALGLALPAWRNLLRRELGRTQHDSWAVLLFAVLPAVQIYFLAAIDAVVAGLLLAALAQFLRRDSAASLLLSALCVAATSFLTYGVAFIFPVLVGFELLQERSLKRSVAVVAFVSVFYGLLYAVFGYSYWTSFELATAMENQEGFLLLAHPKQYFWSRVGSVLEIAIFFTPFLCLQLLGGYRELRLRAARLYTLSWLGSATLLAMLLAGAFRIGETARICMFVLPCLLLPAVAAATAEGVSDRARDRLLASVLGMALIMQLFGFYRW